MPLDSYANLQAAVVKWAFREGDDSFTASVPDFIALAETRMNRELRLTQMETTAPLTLANGVATLPDDYLEFRSVATVGALPRVLYSSAAPDWSDQFSIGGGALRIGAMAAGGLTLVYYAKIPALSDANPTNWLLQKAPDLYLYGTLLESAPFMMDDARLGTWTTLYQKALDDLIAQDALGKYARASVRLMGATP